MIEVLFDESECAAMKMALYLSNRLNTSQVICMPFMLDVGDIKSFIESGETIRIWYSDAPYSMSGFHHACSILRTYNLKAYAVKLPQVVKLENDELQVLTTWGAVRAEDLLSFTSLEIELLPHEIEYYASVWDKLKTENSQLRAVINGKLISVPDDFYDWLIKNEIPEGTFILSHLIERILINHPLGIGDRWIATRIQKMIENGELSIVEKNEDNYWQILKRRN